MKPVVFYIDDQEHALTAFEMNLPDDWEIHTYSNPVKAIADFQKFQPWVIVSDQLMPDITGVELLSIAAVHVPDAIRILTTAYSGEDLLIRSVQEAHIYGYIPKPWSEEAILSTVTQASNFYRVKTERNKYFESLEAKQTELIETQKKLEQTLNELKAWIPPIIYQTITSQQPVPEYGSFVGIAYDIVASSNIRDIAVEGKPLKNTIASLFTQMILKYGGFIECHAGDYAYGHFGLSDNHQKLCNLALSAANEFRMNIRSLSEVHGLSFECGIALHAGENIRQTVNSVSAIHNNSVRTHKWYETDSSEVDFLHRIEKLVHALPGSNIVLSRNVFDHLSPRYQSKFTRLGLFKGKGQDQHIEIFLCASDKVNKQDLDDFIETHIDSSVDKLLNKEAV